eukprot:TRINITY_DN11299_c0_g1_i1.p2 TRINITY_DN11299_c0_g1~~TRINITY_DN11299_c0_g1_i1.p2  ORF type:complete len:170 (+),score=45.16 TRINITY_DN11299_c0_g1_i1:36-545(+)
MMRGDGRRAAEGRRGDGLVGGGGQLGLGLMAAMLADLQRPGLFGMPGFSDDAVACAQLPRGQAGQAVRLYHRRQSSCYCPSAGIAETRQSVLDSAKGVEQLHVRRDAGDQWVAVRRVRQLATGIEETTKTNHNVRSEEEEAWSRRWDGMAAASGLRSHAGRPLPLRRRR